MVCGQQNNNVVLCSGAGGCAFKGSGKENYMDVSKVYYLRCTKIISNFKRKDWLSSNEATGLWRDYPPWPAFSEEFLRSDHPVWLITLVSGLSDLVCSPFFPPHSCTLYVPIYHRILTPVLWYLYQVWLAPFTVVETD